MSSRSPAPLLFLLLGATACPSNEPASGDTDTDGTSTSTTEPASSSSTGVQTGTTTMVEPDSSSSDEGSTTSSGDGTTSSSGSSGSSSGTDEGSTSTTDAASSSESSSSTGEPAVCGDEIIAGDEVCDGADLAGETCASQGYSAGTLSCADSCDFFDVTACTTCGDDVIEPTEQCEGTDLAGESCESLGLYPGVLGCNPTVCNFDVSGCGPYFEDFELGVLPFEYTIGGDLGWVIDNSSAYSGVHAAHNGPITDGQTSWIELQGNFVVEGELSFRHRESTESGVDFLRLYIDGAEVGSWSGTNGWNESSFPVSAGAHVFQWRYEKDNSVSAGEDRVWIDDVYLLVGSAI